MFLYPSWESRSHCCLFQCPTKSVFRSISLTMFPMESNLITILLQTVFTDLKWIGFLFFCGLLSQLTSWQFKNIVVLTASKFRRLIFRILFHFLSVPVTLVVLLIWVMLLMYCLLCSANNKVTSNLKHFVLFWWKQVFPVLLIYLELQTSLMNK